MEMIEGVLWIMTGFTPTLVSMELAWRLCNRPIAVKQEIMDTIGRV